MVIKSFSRKKMIVSHYSVCKWPCLYIELHLHTRFTNVVINYGRNLTHAISLNNRIKSFPVKKIIYIFILVWIINGSGHVGAAVLLPGFAIIW